MTKILHLFSDTNLLIQCRPVEELDWEQWKEFDEVHVIVSRPVQKETDKHKNSGSDRLAKRPGVGDGADALILDLVREATLGEFGRVIIGRHTGTKPEHSPERTSIRRRRDQNS